MAEIWPDSRRHEALSLLPSWVVDTNEWLRQRAQRLANLGCSQKVIAAKMGMQAGTFSRWLRQTGEIGPASVAALDGFNEYVRELIEALTDAQDAIRQTNIADPRTIAARPTTFASKADGPALADSGTDAKSDQLPSAIDSVYRGTLADVERITGVAERRLERMAPRGRAVGKRPPTTRDQKAGRRKYSGKNRG